MLEELFVESCLWDQELMPFSQLYLAKGGGDRIKESGHEGEDPTNVVVG